jgi:hypothetical protein
MVHGPNVHPILEVATAQEPQDGGKKARPHPGPLPQEREKWFPRLDDGMRRVRVQAMDVKEHDFFHGGRFLKIQRSDRV